MDFATLEIWILLFAAVVTTGNTLWMVMSRPWQNTRTRHETLKNKMDDKLKTHDRRIQKVEDALGHLPTKDDLHDFGQKLTRLETEMESVGRTVHRIDDYLRSQN